VNVLFFSFWRCEHIFRITQQKKVFTPNQLASVSLAYCTPVMSAYFKQKHDFSKCTFISTSWPYSFKEFKWLSTRRQLTPFKLRNGLWPTHYVLYQCKSNHPPLTQGEVSVQRHTVMLTVAPKFQHYQLQQWHSVETIF
jgi:hypothetical protein